MEYFDIEINNQVSARIYYSRAGRQIYFVDNRTGSELCKVNLVDGVDLSYFLCIISSGGDVDGSRT